MEVLSHGLGVGGYVLFGAEFWVIWEDGSREGRSRESEVMEG